MSAPPIHPLVDEGLGNTAWLIDLGDGRALAVDPPRDLRALRAVAERRGLTVAYAADTHLHADFLTGAVQLAATDHATILASADGHRAFDHYGLHDGDEVDLGGLTLRALTTPGHTDEHLSFLLLDGPTPLGVFTGGSLIVGSAARTDLLGADRTEELARAQYASLHRLAALPDATAVWPTHGAGSFCSAPPGAARSSTIGTERATNPLLAAPDADTFVARLVASLGSYPSYFARLGELNRRGPAVITDGPMLPALDVPAVRRLLADGAVIVDVRPVADIAAGHIPGAVANPLRPQFATWLGWLVAPDTPVVIVRNPDQDPADIVWPALNIGFDRIVGELAGGMPAWRATRAEVSTTRLVTPDQMPARGVLDIRQHAEYTSGHLPRALHLELGHLPQQAGAVPSEALTVMCGHGERAMTAATLLERAGHRDLSVLVGGAEDWATATGQHLEEGA
ncbi:MBL fold metallo-hydrolase [Couchioplanes caeruleus]|uniref:Hydrolase n=2 Tax=Couchioplanes caeruleus TaxID=56438 RepID=A0A1K0FBX8_9ACTN|nr:MBL fold metallo-hydrolase [Couchioplanes caeruleus]OJF10351.1 hydrolase [Couchioplanes caeruleus subsp. caeruleus]ROP32288.1 glyoxylase-like metal-dependent hydrolase (beta-lactamase superfamily II) [Couchioplanes caeruleus]